MEGGEILALGIALVGLGLAGIALRRNILMMLISLEVAMNGLFLSAFSLTMIKGAALGQSVALIFMAVAAGEAALGLAIAILVFREIKSVDTDKLAGLKG